MVTAHRIVRLLVHQHWTLADLDSLPWGVALPLRQVHFESQPCPLRDCIFGMHSLSTQLSCLLGFAPLQAIQHCRSNPPTDWPQEAYVLIGVSGAGS